MLIGWINNADAALITVGSQVPTLPGSNVQQPHVCQKWATISGVTGSSLTFDMRSSVACALLSVIGTNMSAAATLRLRASDVDPAALATLLLDTGAIAAGIKAGYGAAYKSFAPITARYWRLDLTDATLPDHIEVGRVFLGSSWAPSVNQLWDYNITAVDDSPITRSYGKQDFPDVRPQQRLLIFELEWMDRNEMYTNAFALARANGVVKDILVIPDINSPFVSEESVWGLLTASQPLTNRSSRRVYQKFSVKERL